MKKAVLFLLTIIIISCDNITHTSFLKVHIRSPHTEYVDNIEDLENIQLFFSEKVVISSVESEFSLSAAGNRINGYYTWIDARTMSYIPYEDFYPNVLYEVTLGNNAEDIFGNSLEEPFTFNFSSSNDRTRPLVESITPGYFEVVDDPFFQIDVVFDEPIMVSSYIEGASISPSVSGYWIHNDDSTSFSYIPTEKFSFNETYTLTLSNRITDISGNNIEKEIKHIFLVEGDNALPELIELGNTVDIHINTFEPFMHTNNWNRTDNIHLIFSKPIDFVSLQAGISIEPAWNFSLEEITPGHYLLSSDDDLIWDTIYLLTLDTKIKDLYENKIVEPYDIYLRVNGLASQPPSVERVLLYSYDTSNPASPTESFHDELYDKNATDHFHVVDFSPFDSADVNGYIDFYLTIAEGATIDFYNFAENFTINSDEDNVVDFVIFHLEMISESVTPFWGSIPANPLNNYIVRVYSIIMNNNTGTGYITIKLRSGFKDSLNNELPSTWETKIWGANNP